MKRHPTRPDSRYAQFYVRTPADVLERVRGRVVTVPLPAQDGDPAETFEAKIGQFIRGTLGTRNPRVADSRRTEILAHLNRMFVGVRAGPGRLTQEDVVALAGEVYQQLVDENRADPGTVRQWESFKALVRAAAEGRIPTAPPIPVNGRSDDEVMRELLFGEVEGDELTETIDGLAASWGTRALEQRVGRLAFWTLQRHGIEVDTESNLRLLREVARAALEAGKRLKAMAGGDYRPDPAAERFPPYRGKAQAPDAGTLTGILEAWWTEAKATGRKPSTHESYRNTITNFVAFLKHDDAGRVTADDVVRFKDHRLASKDPRTGKPISAKTVKDSDLTALKAVLGWAVSNRRLPANPAKDVTIKLGKSRRLRGPGFTDDEAKAILAGALAYRSETERPGMVAAKRWVPWLAAYTGARVGELAQLRREDVRREGEHWIIHITPEAGTVKTDEARDVPLHPHLVEMGFLAFVEGARPGHLFLRPAKTGDVLGPLQGVKNRLSEFGRSIVADPNVAPNHGWRHRFKSLGIEAGISDRVLDAIQGHAPRTAGDRYGEVTVKTKAEAISRLPRIAVDDGAYLISTVTEVQMPARAR